MTTLSNLVGNLKSLLRPAAPQAAGPAVTVEPRARMNADAFIRRGASQQLVQASRHLANAVGQVDDAMSRLAGELQGNPSQLRQAQIQHQLAFLQERRDGLNDLKSQVGRLAATPGARPADVERMASLAAAAGLDNSSQELRKLGTEMQDIARNAGRTTPSSRELFHATKGVDDRLAQVEGQMAGLTRKAMKAGSAQEMMRIQLELADLSAGRNALLGLKGQMDKLADNPKASPADTQRMSQLAAHAMNSASMQELRKIGTEMQDIARNAGRTPPSSRELFHATMGVDNRLGQIEEQMAHLANKARTAGSQRELTQIQVELADLGRQKASLQDLKGHMDKLADNPKASPADVQRMSQLAAHAMNSASMQELRKIGTEMADIARNAGRTTPSDRGLHHATLGLNDYIGRIESAMADLANRARTVSSPMELTRVQLELDDLSRQKSVLEDLAGSADRLADKPGASTADSNRMSDLLAQAVASRSQNELVRISQMAADLAR